MDCWYCGRLFNWYRGDGQSMSRLDRYLLSVNWCSAWPNCFQVANQRGLSDHVPLVLSVDVDNWGPRPLRMFKCWADFPGYAQFVWEKWGSFNIERLASATCAEYGREVQYGERTDVVPRHKRGDICPFGGGSGRASRPFRVFAFYVAHSNKHVLAAGVIEVVTRRRC